MSQDPRRIPVLVGLGQSIEREEITSVVELTARAAEAAFAEAPGLSQRVGRLTAVAAAFSKVGPAVASEVAERLGLEGVSCEGTHAGGNTPQYMVNRACSDIAAGRLETTLVCGAEATRSMQKADPDADFFSAGFKKSESDREPDPVVGIPVDGMLSPQEIEARFWLPAQIYPLIESAMQHEAGRTMQEQREHIARFMARSSDVAAKNPFAWFPESRTAESIATPSERNRITAEPYTKCMNSFANVDLGAAVLITNLEVAREAGLEDQCVYPWAGATNAEVPIACRPKLARSEALRAAASALFSSAGLGIDDMDVIDIYSCFPVAVQVGALEIGLDIDDPRGLTVTGGMSFFGGPGNNYATHGIVGAAQRIREGARFGYVSGNGGMLSKHSLGIYGNEPPAQGYQHPDTSREQEAINASAIEAVSQANGRATVDGSTIVYGRDGEVASAPVIATLEDGKRVVAMAKKELLSELEGRSLVGETIEVEGESPPLYSI